MKTNSEVPKLNRRHIPLPHRCGAYGKLPIVGNMIEIRVNVTKNPFYCDSCGAQLSVEQMHFSRKLSSSVGSHKILSKNVTGVSGNAVLLTGDFEVREVTFLA